LSKKAICEKESFFLFSQTASWRERGKISEARILGPEGMLTVLKGHGGEGGKR